MLIFLITVRNVSFGSNCWSSLVYSISNFYSCRNRGNDGEQRCYQKSTCPHTPITKTSHWPMSSVAAIKLRSPPARWQGLLAMWPLQLHSDYLYYPITALNSDLHPGLVNTVSVWSSSPHFSCLFWHIKCKKKAGHKKWKKRAIYC